MDWARQNQEGRQERAEAFHTGRTGVIARGVKENVTQRGDKVLVYRDDNESG